MCYYHTMTPDNTIKESPIQLANIKLMQELLKAKKEARRSKQVAFTTLIALEEAKITIAEKEKAIDYWKERSRLGLIHHVA